MTRSHVLAALPRAGLGNMLLVWGRASVFAHINDLPLVVSGWGRVSLGPFLRREKHKRLYRGYFIDDFGAGPVKRALLERRAQIVREPEIVELSTEFEAAAKPKLYIFDTLPHWSDYFAHLRENHAFVRSSLLRMVHPRHVEIARKAPAPVIGIHLRMGDMRSLTSLPYFVTLIQALRAVHGGPVPVTLFSDGYDHELTEILSLPAVTRAAAGSDIAELLMLSRSQLIVLSAGSTFGLWATFLSDAPALMHSYHLNAPVRPSSITEHSFEGAVDPECPEAWPGLLLRSVTGLKVAP